jgi:hypothetical protein
MRMSESRSSGEGRCRPRPRQARTERYSARLPIAAINVYLYAAQLLYRERTALALAELSGILLLSRAAATLTVAVGLGRGPAS